MVAESAMREDHERECVRLCIGSVGVVEPYGDFAMAAVLLERVHPRCVDHDGMCLVHGILSCSGKPLIRWKHQCWYGCNGDDQDASDNVQNHFRGALWNVRACLVAADEKHDERVDVAEGFENRYAAYEGG